MMKILLILDVLFEKFTNAGYRMLDSAALGIAALVVTWLLVGAVFVALFF